jgi:hypothetical protein
LLADFEGMIPMQKLIYFLTAFFISLSCHAVPNNYWGKNIMDLGTFNELNTQATQTWAQIVKEQGPRAAVENFLSAKITDPRIAQFHENVLQYLGSSTVNGTLGLMVQLSATNDMAENLTSPFSPFFRQVLTNIALTRALQIYDRVSGFFSVMPESSFNHSVWCVIANDCAEGLAPKYASTDATYRSWVRQYMVAKYLLAANFPNMCATYLDGRYTVATLKTLLRYSYDEKDGSLNVSFASPAKDTWDKIIPCIVEKNGGYKGLNNYDPDEIATSAKKYLRGL